MIFRDKHAFQYVYMNYAIPEERLMSTFDCFEYAVKIKL